MTCKDCIHYEVCSFRSQVEICNDYPSENCKDYKDKTNFVKNCFSDNAIIYIVQWCIESQAGSDEVVPFLVPYLHRMDLFYLLKIRDIIEHHKLYGRWFGDHYYHIWNNFLNRVNDIISYKEIKHLHEFKKARGDD